MSVSPGNTRCHTNGLISEGGGGGGGSRRATDSPQSSTPLSTSASRHVGAQGQHPKVHRGVAFKKWGLSTREGRFDDVAVSWNDCNGKPGSKLLVKDVIAELCFQQSLTRASEFDVIATMNLNGGLPLGRARGSGRGHRNRPGSEHQLRDRHGIFEATHGTAPKYAAWTRSNPVRCCSLRLMFEPPGRTDAATHRSSDGADDRRQDRHV